MLSSEIQKMVAIKKMKIDDKTGIEQTTIRELKILGEIKHENVIGLRDVFVIDNTVYLVLDYMVCDLGKLIDSKNVSLNHQDISYIFHRIVKGICHLHQNWILHRVRIFVRFMGLTF